MRGSLSLADTSVVVYTTAHVQVCHSCTIVPWRVVQNGLSHTVDSASSCIHNPTSPFVAVSAFTRQLFGRQCTQVEWLQFCL